MPRAIWPLASLFVCSAKPDSIRKEGGASFTAEQKPDEKERIKGNMGQIGKRGKNRGNVAEVGDHATQREKERQKKERGTHSRKMQERRPTILLPCVVHPSIHQYGNNAIYI